MLWHCAICTDILNLSKPICFAPCGHIFHRGCLETWLLQSRTCPECRTFVKSASLKKVFPNGKLLSDEMLIAHNVDAMQEKIREQKEANRLLTTRYNDIKEFATKFESEAASYKQKYLDSEHKLQHAHLSLKKFKPLEIENKNLKIELANLNAENELYKNVKTIIQGQQQEVEKIISEYQSNDKDCQKVCKKSVQNLATFLAVLKREYNMLVNTKNKLSEESACLKMKMTVMNQKYLKLQNKYKDVQTKSPFQKKVTCATNVLPGVDFIEDSPISMKLIEKKKICDVVVLDDDAGGKPSSSSASNNTEIEHQNFPINKNRGRFPIAIGPNVQNYRSMIHPDPKLVRRVKLSKKIIK